MRFVIRDPKKGSSGSASDAPARSGPVTQDVAVFSAADDARCCVPPLPHHPARGTGKQQYDYSVCVVHFRIVVYRQKIGSPEKSSPVIYRRDCFSAYYVWFSFVVYKMNHCVYIHSAYGKSGFMFTILTIYRI